MSNGGPPRPPSLSSSSFHFAAGLGSGLLSAFLLQPADLLKTRIQQSRASTLRSTLRAIAAAPHPVRQLWRGTVPSALRTGFGSALYFSTLNALRQAVARGADGVAGPLSASASSGTSGTSAASVTAANVGSSSQKTPRNHSSTLPRLSNTANLATGAAARAAAGFVMMPVTVLKVRYESSFYQYGSLLSAARSIAATEGLRGFFTGFGATAVRDAPYAGLYVLFYEQGKRRLSLWSDRLEEWGWSRSRSWDGDAKGKGSDKANPMSASTSATINFISSTLAAGLATTLTNPFDAIKTRLQLMPERYANTLAAGRLMLREEGVRSLFDGLALRVARKAASSALAWTLYEELIRRAERRLLL